MSVIKDALNKFLYSSEQSKKTYPVLSKDRLKEIKEAHEEGLISAEEFEKAKKEFLNL